MKKLVTIFQNLADCGELKYDKKYKAFYVPCIRLDFSYTNENLVITQDNIFHNSKIIDEFFNMTWKNIAIGVTNGVIRNGIQTGENLNSEFKMVVLLGNNNEYNNILVIKQTYGLFGGILTNNEGFSIGKDSVAHIFNIVKELYKKLVSNKIICN